MISRQQHFRSYLTFRLEQIATSARSLADEIYRTQCGLDLRHVRILRLIAEAEGKTVNQVVVESRLERSLVSRIISELVDQGLIVRAISPIDARQFLVSVTPDGLERVEAANEIGDLIECDLRSTLTERELQVFEQCLEKLVRWVPCADIQKRVETSEVITGKCK